MSELYPDDAALLAMETDDDTGVEYIPTGRSPYYLEFRKLIQRLLESTRRANDLRVYADGALSVGVRPGRCVMASTPIDFAGQTGVAVDDDAATYVWLDTAGAIVTDNAAFPTDRTAHIPLAIVTASSGAIVSIDDRRGEAFLLAPDTGMLGLTATAAEINQALDGIGANVDAAALDTLTGGSTTTADTHHRHLQTLTSADAETEYRLVNDDAGGSANIALRFDLSSKLPGTVDLLPDPASGFLKQRYLGSAYALVGTVHLQHAHTGELTATATGQLVGVVPADGVIDDVVLSIGTNTESTTTTDGIAATVKAAGVAVTTTDPAITDAAGTGARSTAAGDGQAAVVRSDGGEIVTRGSMLTVDLTRTAAGTVSQEATDVVVLVVVRPDGPR